VESKPGKNNDKEKGRVKNWVFSCSVQSKETSSVIEENQNKWLTLIEKNIKANANPNNMLDPEEEEFTRGGEAEGNREKKKRGGENKEIQGRRGKKEEI